MVIGKRSIFVLFILVVLSASTFALQDLKWTAANSFRIYESGSTTWGAGTLICQVTLTDDNAADTSTCGTSLSASTQYRIEVILTEDGITGPSTMDSTDDFVKHKVKAWAGTSPTLGACVFNDFDTDDTSSPACAVAIDGTDISMTISNGGIVNIAENGGTQGFGYLITLDSDAVSTAASFMDADIDGETEDSSKISITIAATAVPELGDYALILILVTTLSGFFAMKQKI